MGKEFWINRWEQGAIGWHQSEVEPALKEWASGRKPTRILVPLCGKTLDMVWLRDQGYEVVGVELSSLACETFFNENQIPFKKTQVGNYFLYEGERILLINGDFFELDQKLVGDLGAVYDRAALIALPPKLRLKYSQKIIDFKVPEIFQIVLVRSPLDEEGPPYCVTPDEVSDLYGKFYNIQILKRYPVEARGPIGSVAEECLLQLLHK
jgi:thiopurine S-methyltransferase